MVPIVTIPEDAALGLGVSSINGVSGLTSLIINSVVSNEGLSIDNMPDMTVIDAPHLTSVTGGVFFIGDSASLIGIPGFNELISSDVDITITSNPLLTSISGFNALTHILSGAGLFTSGNSSLDSITGFSHLVSVDGRLAVSSNRLSSGCPGFDSLTYIGEGLAVSSNTNLVDLSGFNALTRINLPSSGTAIYASNNTLMTSVSGLNSLSIINGGVDFSWCALDITAVNKILAMLVASTLDGVNPWSQTLDISAGTNAVPDKSPGSDYDTLVGRGSVITTN
jgi:hypothetical protein